MTGLPLFETYPDTPGWKGQGGTSKAAAESIAPKSGVLRERVKALFLTGKRYTADEVAGELGLSILSARPRVAELAALGFIEDSGARGRTRSGHSCIVWRRKPAQ